ncbi:glycosyltransferase [Bacteroides caecigallinarum]|uniref:glycosyltransferase n=1 Tax=Bacteroides caecigallinarum TaxID=1411144 RepID=UPI001F1F25A1|nr:glycosyltransferase [Bacteroides caecigallinarum]MCF2738802.1 glycosyltransferase [Bacteroides caecigallinarum]
MKNIKPLVSIHCLVYNHEQYLRQCLDGFIMQKTNFAFEAIVHDDASTDNSAEIIREYADKYPNIIKPIYEIENQYSKKDGSLTKIMNKAFHPDSKYIAYCEGDDYWIDPYKLQKQVDILESDSNISMVYTNFNTVNERGEIEYRERYEKYKKISRSGDLFMRLLFSNNFIMTVTTMYRKEILFSNKIISQSPVSLDYLVSLTAAGLGNLYYLNEVTSSYRNAPNGQMNSNMKVVQSSINIIRYYIEYCYINNGFRTQSINDTFRIKSHFIRTSFTSLIPKKYKYSLVKLLFRKPTMIPITLITLIRYGATKLYNKFK